MTLPWDKFAALDGAPQKNFELLCRSLVQRNYGRFGQLRSRRNQPGIEFHLQLRSESELGSAGRWFGWQCRWYDLPANHSLGQRRRKEILDAIEKGKADVEGLTDFVLCLRELPRKGDLDWYDALNVGLRLHRWGDEEIEARLTGDAEILRRTYFGELVLTAAQLAETQARTIEPVKQRWLPGLHVVTAAETALRTALARPGSAAVLQEEGARLQRIAAELHAGHHEIDGDELRELSVLVATKVAALAQQLTAIVEACDGGDPGEARELIGSDATPRLAVRDVRLLARRLRAQRVGVALAASTVEADIRHALALLADCRRLMLAPLIAIVGEAGRGKTQLAAQMTAPSAEGLAGVFLRGFDLPSGGSLDDVASRLPGINAKTFDELLEAADAAGERNQTRVPIVIDGLNDAERPAEWHAQLAQLMPILNRYDNVLLIVTLRGAVRDQVLPVGSCELELEWQNMEIEKAVARYFEHYLIDPGSARLPMRLFGNPLFLRMFCEAVNLERAKPVGVEALPGSLVAVFELYRAQTARRLRSRPGHPSLAEGHVEKQLARIADELWKRGVRELAFDELKQLVDAPGVSWDDSLVRALEEEGVLLRDNRMGWTDQRSAFVFDRLAGYLIADAIIRRLSIDRLDDELSAADMWAKLEGPQGQRHPLAEDIVVGLAGVLPRRLFGRQLWKFASADSRDWALLQTLDLESRLLDTETLDALAELIPRCSTPAWRRRHPFDRLWEVRDGVDHLLNGKFLDRVLRHQTVAERDLHWTEWIRANVDELISDVHAMGRRWAETQARDDADDLSSRAVAWLLTSTSLPLRDSATRALQRYGRIDPGRLFALTTDLLSVNDPYVTERLLAASFGAATDHQMPGPGGAFERSFRGWLEELSRRYIGPRATMPTSHQLARQYIGGCFELADRLHPAAMPDGVDPMQLDFGAGPHPEAIVNGDQRAQECDRTFGMDFENYIVGPLYEGRSNYQMDHPRFLAGIAEIRGRVWELGWRSATFSEVEKGIESDQWRRHDSPERTERYGKKYGWIGYYELAGRLEDRGELRDRTWTSGRGVWPDIDPSFPEPPPKLASPLPAWASGGPVDDATWYREAVVDVPNQLLVAHELDGEPGPWLLVEGFVEHRDRQCGRRVWGFFRGVLVSREDLESLKTQLKRRQYIGNHFVPNAPEDHMTFAGEIPWSARFAAAGDIENDLAPYQAVVTERWGEPGIKIEVLGHAYDFAASRTITNLASGHWVPSHNLAAALDLRKRPGALDLVGLDGRTASMSRGAPAGFDGRLLYVRRDVLAAYAPGRSLIQLAWGERQVDVDWGVPPAWLQDAASEHAGLWRRITVVKF